MGQVHGGGTKMWRVLLVVRRLDFTILERLAIDLRILEYKILKRLVRVVCGSGRCRVVVLVVDKSSYRMW